MEEYYADKIHHIAHLMHTREGKLILRGYLDMKKKNNHRIILVSNGVIEKISKN
jgi:hypothetical protein